MGFRIFFKFLLRNCKYCATDYFFTAFNCVFVCVCVCFIYMNFIFQAQTIFTWRRNSRSSRLQNGSLLFVQQNCYKRFLHGLSARSGIPPIITYIFKCIIWYDNLHSVSFLINFIRRENGSECYCCTDSTPYPKFNAT